MKLINMRKVKIILFFVTIVFILLNYISYKTYISDTLSFTIINVIDKEDEYILGELRLGNGGEIITIYVPDKNVLDVLKIGKKYGISYKSSKKINKKY